MAPLGFVPSAAMISSPLFTGLDNPRLGMSSATPIYQLQLHCHATN
jgi:hypothetical protein